MEIGQPQLLEIGNARPHTIEIAGKEIDIADAAQHALVLVPMGICFPLGIEGLQLRRSRQPTSCSEGENLFQVVIKIIAPLVKLQEQIKEAGKVRIQPPPEERPRRGVNVLGKGLLQPGQQTGQGDSRSMSQLGRRGCHSHRSGCS